MNRALFAKAIGDSKLLFAALFALMFAFPFVFLWASGMISLPALATEIPSRRAIWESRS